MATAKIAEVDPIAGLNSILSLYGGKTTTQVTSPSSEVSTTKSNMTDADINASIDMAMAPLNQAAHGAGLSTYSDTNLALGRAQVAADTRAKYAGTTTTRTSSGGKTVQSTPGPLSSSQIGSTIGNLAITQLGAPILKKLAKPISGVLDSFGNSISDALSPTAIGDLSSQFGDYGSDMTDMINEGFASFGDSIGSSVGDVASSVAGSVLDEVSDAADSFFDLFADGGKVKVPGYATGGAIRDSKNQQQYVDRNVSRSNLDAQSGVDPVAAALAYGGGVVENSKGLSSHVDGSQGSSNSKGVAKGDMANIGFGNVAMSAMSAVNPALGYVASKVTGIPTVQAVITAQLKQDILSQQVSQEDDVTDAVSRSMAAADRSLGGGGFSGNGTGTNQSAGGDTSHGEGDGGAGATAADGGRMSGPGTGTSDSIDAKVSNGERIITAKTVQGVEEVFGPDFFLNLERKFNAPAAASQIQKGRA